jgi:hypothetical protein
VGKFGFHHRRKVGGWLRVLVAMGRLARLGGWPGLVSVAVAVLALALTGAGAGASHARRCRWLDRSQPVARRVGGLVSAMTLDQKIAEMHVFSTTSTGPYAGYQGFVPAQPGLCIPALIEQADSQGVGAGARA